MSGSEPGGHKVLWLIIGPAALITIPVFLLNDLADEGVNLMPGTLIGAGLAAALILFLRTSDRPNNPQTLMKARWRWGLFLLPIVAVLWGPPIVVILLGALAAFQVLFVILVGIGMFRDRPR